MLEEAPGERTDAQQHLRGPGHEDCRETPHPTHSATRVRGLAEQQLPRADAAAAAEKHEARETGTEPDHQSQSAAAGEHGDDRHRDVEEGPQSSAAGDGRAEGLTPRAPRECG